jgi:hypothetical protein
MSCDWATMYTGPYADRHKPSLFEKVHIPSSLHTPASLPGDVLG